MVEYNQPDVEHYRKEAAEYSEGGGDKENRFHKLVDGDNYLRILPSWRSEAPRPFALQVWKHYGLPPEDGILYCAKTWGQKCAVCDAVEGFRNETKVAETMRSQVQFYVNAMVYDKNLRLMYPGPMVIRVTWGCYSWLRDQIIDPMLGDPTNPMTGAIVKVTKAGKGKVGTSYKFGKLKESRIAETDEEIVEILSKIHDLDRIFRKPETMDEQLAETGNTVTLYLQSVMEQGGDGPSIPQTALPEEKKAAVPPKAPSASGPVQARSVGKQQSAKPVPASHKTAPSPKKESPIQPPPAAPSVEEDEVAALERKLIEAKRKLAVPRAPKFATVSSVPVAGPAVADKPEGAPECWGQHVTMKKSPDFRCTPCQFEDLCGEASGG